MVHALALRVEDAVQRAVVRALLRAGRPVRVQPFPGTAAHGRARLGGRVLLGAARAATSSTGSGTWQVLRANLAPFVTVELPHARVRVEVAGRTAEVSADREGYLEAVLEGVDLAPGSHAAVVTPQDPAGPPARATLHVPDPAAELAVVSDIDDTIIDSGVAHGLLRTLTTVLLSDAATRPPLDGAPDLYRALADGTGDGPDRPFFYLSTSPWNLLPFLEGFLARHGFPPGPLSLTDWGPGRTGLLRVRTHTHKLTVLRRLAADLPDVRFLLLGDSGQADAEIYTAFVQEHPGRVAAVWIRRAGQMTPERQERHDGCARTLAAAGVPFLLAPDSAAVLVHARSLGLVRG